MILLVVTICLRADPVTIECRTETTRMETTLAACHRMRPPMEAWVRETAAGLPVEWLASGCKGGVME